MKAAPRMIAITGLGSVSPLGNNCEELWRSVEAGRDGIADIARFDTSPFRVSVGACVPRYRTVEITDLSVGFELCTEIAVTAARAAWREANVDAAGLAPERLALCLGTLFVDANPNTEPDKLLALTGDNRSISAHQLSEAIAATMGIDGPRLTVATACASSTNAVGLGADLLRMGSADLVLAGGVDLLNSLVFAGFHSLSVLSPTTCAPFSEPVGTVLGEGAGFVVMEAGRQAAARQIAPKAWFCGYGLSSDAYHETSPDPSGRGVERALNNALSDARLGADDIAYVNAHGTGTAHNDLSEWRGIKRVFGERAERDLLISSSKSFLGHAQGAAGILELVTTILACGRGFVPPTLHFTQPRPHGPHDPVAQTVPRPAHAPYAASLNAGFGGSNAAVIVSMEPGNEAPTESHPDRRPIRVLGIGAIGGFGTRVAQLMDSLDEGRSTAGFATDFHLRDIGLLASRKRIDPLTRYLCAAASMALRDAGIRINKRNRGRAGVIAGITRLSPHSVDALNRSIDTRGLARLSATAFPRMLLNAPTGTCARLLEMRGPNSTVSTGPGSGLVAAAYAAELLARSDSADMLIAGGADELDRARPPDNQGEGGACVLLSRAPTQRASSDRSATENSPAPVGTRPVWLAGWALCGPGQGPTAAATALATAGLSPADVSAVFGTGDIATIVPDVPARIEMNGLLGFSECTASAAALVAATATIRRGDAATVLVLDTSSASASCALALTSRELS